MPGAHVKQALEESRDFVLQLFETTSLAALLQALQAPVAAIGAACTRRTNMNKALMTSMTESSWPSRHPCPSWPPRPSCPSCASWPSQRRLSPPCPAWAPGVSSRFVATEDVISKKYQTIQLCRSRSSVGAFVLACLHNVLLSALFAGKGGMPLTKAKLLSGFVSQLRRTGHPQPNEAEIRWSTELQPGWPSAATSLPTALPRALAGRTSRCAFSRGNF